jgi:hypothetical protein
MNHSSISRKEDDMTTRHHQVITKILVSAAIAVGSYVGLAAPASADTNTIGTNPNPFGALSCNCQTPASVTSPDVTDQINRGIRDALTTDLTAVQGQR